MMKILLTGFEPFGESPINPSQMLVNTLAESDSNKAECKTAILPVDQEKGPTALLTAVNSFKPDAVLSFGLALGRPKISLERIAVNLMDYRIPDNAGNQTCDQPIVPDGPAAYFSTLPLRTLYDALLENEIPVELSLSAGSYLCNQVFYSLLHEISTQQKPIRAGFVHLPALMEQAAHDSKTIPSMDFCIMMGAAKIMIEVLVEGKV